MQQTRCIFIHKSSLLYCPKLENFRMNAVNFTPILWNYSSMIDESIFVNNIIKQEKYFPGKFFKLNNV